MTFPLYYKIKNIRKIISLKNIASYKVFTVSKKNTKNIFSVKNHLVFINNCNYDGFPVFNNLGSIFTTLCPKNKSNQIKRNMMMGVRSVNHIARTAYHAASTLTNDDMINNISKNNHSYLVKNLVELSLNAQKGIPQHKTKIINHILNHKFSSEEIHEMFYEHIRQTTNINPSIIKNEPHTLVDSRFMNELPVIKEFLLKNSKDIEWLLLTNDSRPANFPHQKQTNKDFWVMLKVKLDQAMGLGYKCVDHDEKSGGDMFHSMTGSLGMLTYEKNGVMVPFMNKAQDLADFNLKRIESIRDTLKTGINYPIINDQLELYKTKFKILTEQSLMERYSQVFKLNDEIQIMIWDKFQLNPNFDRSMSFIYVKEISYEYFTEKQQNFADHFKSLLGDKTYNLDKRGDCHAIYRAMLIAYKENIDRDIMKKIAYLNNDITIGFNSHFLHYTASWIKDGLL